MNTGKILKAWLLVGSLDIIAACTQYYIKTGKNPENVLKYVASAVFGKDASAGGTMMSVYGLVFHFINALLFTLFFFFVVSKFRFASANRILTGIGYGAFMWAVMRFLVLPLSNVQLLPLTLTGSLIAIAILIICIGLPLSFIANSKTAQR
jgi:hypothetical protein